MFFLIISIRDNEISTMALIITKTGLYFVEKMSKKFAQSSPIEIAVLSFRIRIGINTHAKRLNNGRIAAK